jgi:hypothetical protein
MQSFEAILQQTVEGGQEQWPRTHRTLRNSRKPSRNFLMYFLHKPEVARIEGGTEFVAE